MSETTKNLGLFKYNTITDAKQVFSIDKGMNDNWDIIDSSTLNHNQITNCLLEVPQNIKLELNDDTLTLKAGSKVIVPNGANVFDQLEITSDCNISPTGGSGKCMICVSANGAGGSSSAIKNCVSGAGVTPVNFGICYDTTTNIVQRWGDGVLSFEKCSLPLAIVTQTDGVTTSIDQIFNGFGYMGSTLWADKGVKGLAPYGRNENGSCNNKEHLLNTAQVFTIPTSANGSFYMGLNDAGVLGYYSPNVWKYDETLNGITLNGAIRYGIIFMGTFSATSGVISNFNPKLSFRAADYNDLMIKYWE